MEVEENVAAVERGPLAADIIARINKIAAMVPFRPFEEPFGVGWCFANPGKYKGPGIA
jgi:hypothetical protein